MVKISGHLSHTYFGSPGVKFRDNNFCRTMFFVFTVFTYAHFQLRQNFYFQVRPE